MQQKTNDIIHLNNYLCNLDPVQKTLCENLSALPPKELLKGKAINQFQQWKYVYDKSQWQILALRLAYFLLKRIGRRMTDPLDCQEFDSDHKKYVDIISRMFLAELDLVIEGWELIESSALKQKNYFLFDHPYQLFEDVCRFRAKDDLSALLSDDAISEFYLSTFQKGLREESRLFRNRLDTETRKQKLDSYKNSNDWVYFAIYAIWNYRHSNKEEHEDLAKAWGEFLKAHKKYVAMYCNENFFSKNVSIDAFTYTGHGEIMIYHNRKMVKAKIINGFVVFPLS